MNYFTFLFKSEGKSVLMEETHFLMGKETAMRVLKPEQKKARC